MEHKYSTKFNNKNLRYAKVGLRVFRGLFPAESFCTAHNLDVNSAIEYGDSPELKHKVQEIARVQNAILQGVLESLDEALEKNNQQFNTAIIDLERARETRDLQTGYYLDRVHEIKAQGSGLLDARNIVFGMFDELKWLAD